MKLYTEEEVKRAMYLAHCNTEEEVLAGLTPIELPSDEEIHKQAINYSGFDNEFNAGAKWMRDKIQGGNNENKS